MRIDSLEVRNLRAISNLTIEPGGSINWIVGKNGAGKTTLLEAIFLLSRGRSFRTRRQGPLCRLGESDIRIVARLETDAVNHSLCFVSTSGRKTLHGNQTRIHRIRDLQDRIQVRILTENSQKLLESPPNLRRLFMDWNLFHVEQSYADLLHRFKRVLVQRNAWLRNGGRGSTVWDEQYIAISEAVTKFRSRFVERLSDELSVIHSSSPFLPSIRLALSKGWPDGKLLLDVVTASKQSDVERGFTQYGPSRADLLINVDGIQGVGSRGQTKIVVAILQIAAQRVLESCGRPPCIWLLDDLRAEIDSESYEEIWNIFERSSYQIFATSIETPEVLRYTPGSYAAKMFHVEQGALR